MMNIVLKFFDTILLVEGFYNIHLVKLNVWLLKLVRAAFLTFKNQIYKILFYF